MRPQRPQERHNRFPQISKDSDPAADELAARQAVLRRMRRDGRPAERPLTLHGNREVLPPIDERDTAPILYTPAGKGRFSRPARTRSGEMATMVVGDSRRRTRPTQIEPLPPVEADTELVARESKPAATEYTAESLSEKLTEGLEPLPAIDESADRVAIRAAGVAQEQTLPDQSEADTVVEPLFPPAPAMNLAELQAPPITIPSEGPAARFEPPAPRVEAPVQPTPYAEGPAPIVGTEPVRSLKLDETPRYGEALDDQAAGLTYREPTQYSYTGAQLDQPLDNAQGLRVERRAPFPGWEQTESAVTAEMQDDAALAVIDKMNSAALDLEQSYAATKWTSPFAKLQTRYMLRQARRQMEKYRSRYPLAAKWWDSGRRSKGTARKRAQQEYNQLNGNQNQKEAA